MRSSPFRWAALACALAACAPAPLVPSPASPVAQVSSPPPPVSSPAPAAPTATAEPPEPSPTVSSPAPSRTTSEPVTPPSAAPAPTTRTPTTAPPPSADLVRRWRGQDIERFDVARPVVALTFDGGADNSAVAPILDTLADNDVPATFFVTGQFARAFPDDVAAMVAAGHPVGNHSDTHPYFSKTPDEGIREELRRAEDSIIAAGGRAAAPLFRFPYGDRTDYDIRVVNDAGYIPIRWTIDTVGWKGTTEGITADVVRQRILDGLRPGAIVLMHVGAHPVDRSTPDADALQGIIDDLRERGYEFATLPQLLAEG
ncbi:polysaccharide deacetylase family protein [Tessaracoccus oleiagri]|uniref:Peptidoglycan/xylan/chitin deacetylase, PgdA/CDA1 family n=1 Tax=Tessaracoccus oleiagri TaxID=686624 RepID=A0A1G9MJB7_9ACTN|nr:polysaccharide deacetylase family protein [Tessaracoccus oleiagri]SDL74376.1 Peptidoglycan/xylan/chitin deacetylase, PgdA/CDA1 family [Tessaracoccus oleiagri]